MPRINRPLWAEIRARHVTPGPAGVQSGRIRHFRVHALAHHEGGHWWARIPRDENPATCRPENCVDKAVSPYVELRPCRRRFDSHTKVCACCGRSSMRSTRTSGAELAGAELMRVARVSSGTLYPILLRFEKAGLFESRWEEETPESLGRPRRRFYRLTQAGAQVAHDALGELSPPISDAAFRRA